MRKRTATSELVSELMDTEQPLDTRMDETELILVRNASAPVEVEESGDEQVRSVPLQSDGGNEADAESDSSEAAEMKSLGRRKKMKRRRQPVISESSSNSEEEEEEEEEEEVESDPGSKLRARTDDVSSWLDDEAEEGEPGSDEEQNMSWEEEESVSSSCNTELVDEEAREAGTGSSRRRRNSSGSTGSEEEEEMVAGSEDDQFSSDPSLPGHLRWKADLAHKAKTSFELRRSRTASLRALVYGGGSAQPRWEQDRACAGDELGGLFHVRRTASCDKLHHQQDSSQLRVLPRSDWSREDMAASVKHLFVTGSWGQDDALVLMEEGDEDQSAGNDSGEEEEEEIAKQRLEKKRKLKKSFDADYDNQEEEEVSDMIPFLLHVYAPSSPHSSG